MLRTILKPLSFVPALIMMYMGEKILIVDDEESMPDLICNYSEKDTEPQDILFENMHKKSA